MLFDVDYTQTATEKGIGMFSKIFQAVEISFNMILILKNRVAYVCILL